MDLTETTDQSKLFIACELKSGDKITASVSYTGNLNGLTPSGQVNAAAFILSLTEVDENRNILFEYDSIKNQYFIDPQFLMPKPDLAYVLKASRFNLGPNVRAKIAIPAEIQPGALNVLNYTSELLNNGKYRTKIKCALHFSKPRVLPAYFHIIARSESGNFFDVESYDVNPGAFFTLAHKPGFLVDYSGLTTDVLYFTMNVVENETTKKMQIEFNNAMEQYYRYNLFASNAKTSAANNVVNPVIAAFNFYSADFIGSFSACSSASNTYDLK